jgi:hypothetical protein
MVAATAAFKTGLTAKLGSDNNQGGGEEPLGLEVLNECSVNAVEISADLFHAIIQRGMHIPAAAGDLDEAHAVLNQATSQETALAELALSVASTGLGRFRGKIEGLEVRALHELEGGLVEFVVRLNALIRRLTAETSIEFRQQAGALGHDGFRDRARGVHQAISRVENRQRGVSRWEPSVTMVRRAIDGDGGRQGLVAGTEEVLSPGP